MSKDDDESGAGCILLIAFVSLAVGIGCLWGIAWGFIAFGATFLLLMVLG